MSEKQNRKLAAIMFTDIVGCTVLIDKVKESLNCQPVGDEFEK